MRKECETARNVVISAIMILAILIVVMSMSSCGSIKFGDYDRWQQVHGKTNCNR